MSPSPVLRTRLRALSAISISAALVITVSVWASRQQAVSPSLSVGSHGATVAFLISDKGAISPEAGTITVNSLLDVTNGTDGLCTLREAISAANLNSTSGSTPGECVAGSSSGSDIINLAVTGTINLTGALPNVVSDMNIAGPGSSQLTVTRSTSATYRIFTVSSGTVTLSGQTLTNGQTAVENPLMPGSKGGDGGGILNSGILSLLDVAINGNRTSPGESSPFTGGAGGRGGGIYNSGTLTMTNCTVSGNSTGQGGPSAGSMGNGGDGGGIFNSGALTLMNCGVTGNSTGDGNSGGEGGGIYNGGGATLKIINSTISGNSGGAPSSSGGGIYSDGSDLLALRNCTITGNTATTGNGIFSNAAAATRVRNTIIAANGSAGSSDVSGPFFSNGHNLIGVSSGNGFTNGVNGDQVGSSGSPLNPHLGPLANNGGPTLTHALLLTSTALDAGDDCVTQAAHCDDPNITQLLTDQRGSMFTRLVDGPDVDTTATVDIGAYEMQRPLASLADTSTNEDTQLTVPFDAGDTSTITSVTASSSDAVLVPNDPAHLSAAVTGSTSILTINPATSVSGTTNITVTVNRTGGPEAKTFMLTVNPVNDAPSFTKGPNQVVNEDTGAQTINNWATSISAGAVDESSEALTFQVTGNTNAGLFAVAPAISEAGTLTYTPVANASGSATITINLKDDGGTASGGVDTSASQTFTITVNAVNDVPSFTKGADQAVNEDAGAQSVTNWGTSLSRGPADESAQTLTFTATNDNNALFSTQPAVSSPGTLTYTPAANANGLATVSVTLKDNGGTANGGVDTSLAQTFTITVNAVNDVPSFTKGANQSVNEDAGAQTVNNWATSISTGPANESGQTVSFNITNNTNAELFSTAPAVSSTGALTYTPAADVNGSATITVNVQDNGGTANGGVDTSAAQTFTITVNSVNDAPSFAKGADQTVNNNAGGQSLVNWATAISAGPANESGQTLTFQITNNTNSALFSAGPTVSPAGTLAYVPASNAGGTATITIRLQDSGGTANAGVNTSASQSFNITVIPVGGFIDFSAATNTTTESSGFTSVTVKRTGDLTRAVMVDYASSANNGLPCATTNGVATPKCDFTAALGTLSFAAGEDTKVVNILVSQDGFVEGPETFTVVLSNPTNNAVLGTTATSTTTIADDATEPAPPTNVIDDARNFVRQHYHDFLNREPDQSGWDFWTNQITSCGSDVACIEVRRIDVSASFFLSIEFQQTGYLVERFYKVGYADATGNSTFGNPHTLAVPIVRANEFLTDTQRIGRGVVVLAPGWEQLLESNKQAYALEFVQTARFVTALPTTMTPTQFVTRLDQNAGGVLTLAEQQTAIALFGGAGNTTNQTARAQAVRMVADDQDLYNAEFNRAFVLAQYFGYLRRNPNDAPDSDYTGYDFWLTKLNQFNGNYINAEMVKAFLSSIEYRQRFGP